MKQDRIARQIDAEIKFFFATDRSYPGQTGASCYFILGRRNSSMGEDESGGKYGEHCPSRPPQFCALVLVRQRTQLAG